MTHNPLSVGKAPLDMHPWLTNRVEIFGKLTDPQHCQPLLDSFNLPALMRQASIVAGKPCIACIPFGRGGYNTVFLLEIDGGPNLVGRLGGSVYGDVRKFSAEEMKRRYLSEVATLAYVRKHTTIPVPAVLHYDVNPDNAVGARYMIIEFMNGPALSHHWRKFTPQQRAEVLAKVTAWELQLLNKSFQASGCIIDEDGTLGPLCHSSRNQSNLESGLGPFSSFRDYLLAHCSSTLSKLQQAADTGGSSKFTTHAINWFSLARSAIQQLSPLAGAAEPPHFSLFHDQLEMSHIFVSPTNPMELIGVIDWEGSRVAPVWDSRFRSTFLDDIRIDASCGEMSQEEADALIEQHRVAIAEGEARPSDTRLWLASLMYMIDIPVDQIQNRGCEGLKLNNKFLGWYEYVCETHAFGSGEAEGFAALAEFIRKHREAEFVT